VIGADIVMAEVIAPNDEDVWFLVFSVGCAGGQTKSTKQCHDQKRRGYWYGSFFHGFLLFVYE
jgi:hypothetical protein